MKAWLLGVSALALAAGAFSPMAQADGPRASSANNWPGMMNAGPASTAPAAAAQAELGPRASSANNWPGMMDDPTTINPAAAPQIAAAPADATQPGPRASSANNWPGMMDANTATGNPAAGRY